MNRAWGIVLFMTFFSAGLVLVGAQEEFYIEEDTGQDPFGDEGQEVDWDDADEDDVEHIGFILNPFTGDGVDLFAAVLIGMGLVGFIGTRVLRLPAAATFYAMIFTANLVPITGFINSLGTMGFVIDGAMKMFLGVVIGMALFGGLIDLAR